MNGTHRKHRSGSFVFDIRSTLFRRATSAFGKLRRGIAGGNRRQLWAVHEVPQVSHLGCCTGSDGGKEPEAQIAACELAGSKYRI